MLPVFAITIFIGAAMLFLVQPMIAKMVLPLLGGSPSVWNTCMVFFQALLLAGYAYAHWSVKWLGLKRQVVVHCVLVCLPLALWAAGQSPIAAPGEGPRPGTAPVGWLLMTLAWCIGPAFLILSTCGPLMQRWFGATDHASAKDPYFLYAASNAGSMIALVAYPLLLEPVITLGQQRLFWSVGYAVFAAATLASAVLCRRRSLPANIQQDESPAPTLSTRVRWVLLAMVPSSLMLAITQYLSTDIAAIPLLWIVPLAVYLLTFIIAFSRRTIPLRVSDRTLPILVLSLAVILLLSRQDPIWIIVILNIAMLFFGAMLCHGQLAASRPPRARLTEFYMLIALGGVLGGAFNALLAPVLFDSLLEYPIILAAVCLFRPRDQSGRLGPFRIITDVGFAFLPTVVALLLGNLAWMFGFLPPTGKLLLDIGVPLVMCYVFVRNPLRFGLAVGALLLVWSAISGRHIDQRRTFFGIYTVQRRPTPMPDSRIAVELLHGTTLHGAQWEDPMRSNEPLIYYHRLGPVGDAFKAFGNLPLCDRVGFVGLGSGSVAAYGRPGQTMTFFEIDPAVVELSTSGRFTYVRDSKARVEFELGDARLSLSRQPDGLFGLLVLDAFSSDAVPVHLLTREAVRMYTTKLKPGGLMLFHVSNRYLELERVISGVSHDLGLAAAMRNDVVDEKESDRELHWTSEWIAVARSPEDLAPLLAGKRWERMQPSPRDRVWTDDYSSFVGIFEWERSR